MAVTLSDMPTAGLNVEALANITSGGTTDVYNPPSGTLNAGELSIVNNTVPITGLRAIQSGGAIAALDASALNIREYFEPGGAGNDLSVYLQTATGTPHSFPIAGNIQSSGGNNVARITVPAGVIRAVWSNLVAGTVFNFMLARPKASLLVDPGDATFSFAVPQIGVTHRAGKKVDAGNIAFDFAVPQVGVTHRIGKKADAGNAAFDFAVPQAGITLGVSRKIDAGNADFGFHVPQPHVTFGRPAGNANFSFAVPPATGTRLRRPSPPRNLSLIVLGINSIRLAWEAPIDNGGLPITSYFIEYSSDGVTWRTLVGSHPSTSYVNLEIPPETLRYYRVSARNSRGLSDPSSIEGARTEEFTGYSGLHLHTDPPGLAGMIKTETLRISCQLQRRWTADFTILSKDGMGLLEVGQSITISTAPIGETATVLFRGTVDRTDLTVWKGTTIRQQNVTCVDFSQILDRFLVVASYSNMSIQAIAEDIFTNTATSDIANEPGITVQVDSGSPPVLDRAVFSYQTVRQVMDEISDLTGWQYYMDYNKVFHLFTRSQVTSNLTLGRETRDITINVTRDRLRNRQYIQGGQDIALPTTEEFAGDGKIRTFNVALPIADEPTITLNGNTQIVGSRADELTEEQEDALNWYWAENSTSISQNHDNVRLTTTDTLAVTYRGYFPILVRLSNDEAISERRAIEGGSGVYEHIQNSPRIDRSEAAVEQGRGLTRRFKDPKETIRVLVDGTILSTAQPGNLIAINDPIIGINDTYMVEGINLYVQQSVRFIKEINLISGESYGGWTEWFRHLELRSGDSSIRGGEDLLRVQGIPDTAMITDALMIDTGGNNYLAGSARIGSSKVV